jgi:hypothetical protein
MVFFCLCCSVQRIQKQSRTELVCNFIDIISMLINLVYIFLWKENTPRDCCYSFLLWCDKHALSHSAGSDLQSIILRALLLCLGGGYSPIIAYARLVSLCFFVLCEFFILVPELILPPQVTR